MKTKALTAALLAILFVGTAAAQTTDRPTTKLEATLLTTDPVPLQTGEDADVTFKITNRGNKEAENVTVKILDRYPYKLKPDRRRTYQIGKVAPGEAYYISTEVLVNEQASDGSHPLQVQISQKSFSRTAKIPLEVQGQDIDLNLANLKTTPSTLMPGTEDNRMTLEVVNNGEKTAENVVLDLGFPDFFEKRSSFSTRQALGNIAPGEVKKAEFSFDLAEDAPKGSTEIKATMSYTSGDSTARIEKEEIFSTFISGKPQFKVVNTSSDLSIGKRGNLRITVRNTGEEKSTSTRIRVLDSSDLPFSYSSSSQFIGTLEPGQKGTAVFDIKTEKDAVAKNYLLDFEIRGVKDTEVFTEDTTLKVDVDGSGKKSSGLPAPLPVIGAVAILIGAVYLFRDRIFGSSEPEDGESQEE